MQYETNIDQSYDQIAHVLVDWFHSAQRTISLSTGLSGGILNRPEVRRELIEAGQRGVRVEILIGPEVDAKFLQRERYLWIWDELGGQADVRRSRVRNDHWVLIDESRVRVEQPHDPGAELRSNFRITNCRPAIARRLRSAFEEVFATAVRIERP